MEQQYARKLVTPTEVRALKKGRLEGQLEGRLEGRLEGQRDSIRAFLLARFGELPDALDAGLETVTDGEALNRLVQQAATVGSAADFLALLAQEGPRGKV